MKQLKAEIHEFIALRGWQRSHGPEKKPIPPQTFKR